jgi:branched-chain amino acid transport system ATP-binding protein
MRSATTPLYILKEDPTPHTVSENDPVVLQLDQLSRHFGGVKAVQDVSLEARKGQITSLIGPNGAGKTTVFNAITGIFPPTSGKVLFTPRPGAPTRDISRLRTSEICEAGIARTFQNIRLFTDLPVLENVKVGLHSRTHSGVFGSILTLPKTIREEDDINKAAIHYLDFVGLFHKANETADNLSYGDQRRVEIARALATHPRLLLLDEPAAGMNPQETGRLMDLIYKVREAGVSVFLIEHDMKLVMQISDHVVCVDHGIRISGGSPESVREDPKVVEAYLGVPEEETP